MVLPSAAASKLVARAARVEALEAEIHGIGAGAHGRPHRGGVAGGGQHLGTFSGHRRHA